MSTLGHICAGVKIVPPAFAVKADSVAPTAPTVALANLDANVLEVQ